MQRIHSIVDVGLGTNLVVVALLDVLVPVAVGVPYELV